MTTNQLKKLTKRILPRPIFAAVQRWRVAGHKPSPDVEDLRTQHFSIQSGNPDEITLRTGITLRIHPESRHPFEWFCFRAPEMAREFDYFLSKMDGFDSFVDVGANHGIFSLAFCLKRPKGEVLAVDPSPIAFEILEQNRSLNAFSQLTARNVACGDMRGSVQMKANWHHLEAVSSESTDQQGAVSVPMVPLDDLCAEHDIWPGILKVDVEGFELPVLRGAEKALHRATVLLLEVHPERIDELRYPQVAIFDHLVARSWSIRNLEGTPIDRARFADQIHVFWTVCQKCNAAT